MLKLSFRFSPNVPAPVIPLTVTVYTDELTAVRLANVEATLPVVTTEKSVRSTPVTGSLNVTVNDTRLSFALSPAGLVRLIDAT